MAFESPGFANSGGTATYSAEQTRRAVFAAYARTAANSPGIISGGLVGAADLALTAPGSGLSVNVGTGECIVGGSEGASQGGYYAKNNATVNLSIAAANPTNPRIDTVCVTISDGNYTEPTGGSGNQVAAQVVTGTPTSGANLTNLSGAATLPLSSLLLGYVLVPATASNIITADIANKAGVIAFQGLTSLPGRLLARQFYAPGTNTQYTLTTGPPGTSGSQSLDTANLTVSFTAPNSGAVIVRLQAYAGGTSTNYQVWYLVTHSTTTIVGNPQIALGGSSAGATGGATTVDYLVTGLTAGNTYQYDWAGTASAAAACSVQVGAGGTSPYFGAGVMEVFAA